MVLGERTGGRQHYVPRLYLSRFAHDGVVAAYDMETDRAFASSPANLAVERSYNDFVVDDVVLSTEDWLAQVESTASPILAKLVDRPGSIRTLSAEEEVHFARYLAAQKFRGPGHRDWEGAMRGRIVEQIKPIAKAVVDKTVPEDVASDLWKHWQEKPEEWWLQEEEPIQDAEGAAYMLSEVQGWANLLRAMNWRTGRCSGRDLYTGDNPLADYLPPVRPWWAGGGAIWEHGHVFPLSPDVLVWIYPLGYETETKVKPRGKRWHRRFTRWETSVALHIVSRSATRFLFGAGPYVSRQCASLCLQRIDSCKTWDAVRLQGYDPRPPAMEPFDWPSQD